MSTNYDEQIETALKALQQAEPDDAMQGRILSALQAAEAAQRPAARMYRWPDAAVFYRAMVPWFAAAAILLAAGGTLLLHRYGSRGTDPDQATQSVATALGRDLPSSPIEKSSPPLEGVQDENSTISSGSATQERVPHVSQRHGIQLQAAAETHVLEASRGASTAPAEDRSFPAPPLPLTEQERLLVRLVHREPPQQLAQLTTAALNAGFQHEKDAVTEFFAPAPPLRGQQEPPSYVSQTGQQ